MGNSGGQREKNKTTKKYPAIEATWRLEAAKHLRSSVKAAKTLRGRLRSREFPGWEFSRPT